MYEIEKDPLGVIRNAMIDAGATNEMITTVCVRLTQFWRQPLMPASDLNGLLDMIREMRTVQQEYERSWSDDAKVQKVSHERRVDSAIKRIGR